MIALFFKEENFVRKKTPVNLAKSAKPPTSEKSSNKLYVLLSIFLLIVSTCTLKLINLYRCGKELKKLRFTFDTCKFRFSVLLLYGKPKFNQPVSSSISVTYSWLNSHTGPSFGLKTVFFMTDSLTIAALPKAAVSKYS